MKDSTDNVAYLPHAARNQDATPPAKDIGPLPDDEQRFVETYRHLSRSDRTHMQRLLTRWLNNRKDQQQ
jgi:hypothetical protein